MTSDSFLKIMAQEEELIVKVASASQVFFDGKARSVSGFNRVGPFDILPEHENFISLIENKVVVQDISGKKHEFACNNGLLEVSHNLVRVFVGI